jgi:hypothetical protein
LTQFALNRKIEHPVFLSESGSDSPTSLDTILGHDLICKLGLDLKFNDDSPAIIWEDIEKYLWSLMGTGPQPKSMKHLKQFLKHL